MEHLLTFLIALTPVSILAGESEMKKSVITVEVPKIGVAQIIEEEFGEPIAAPTRIAIKMKCAKSAVAKELVFFRGCKLDRHEYDKETNVLTIKVLSARVVHNTGEVKCDQIDSKEINLKSACK